MSAQMVLEPLGSGVVQSTTGMEGVGFGKESSEESLAAVSADTVDKSRDNRSSKSFVKDREMDAKDRIFMFYSQKSIESKQGRPRVKEKGHKDLMGQVSDMGKEGIGPGLFVGLVNGPLGEDFCPIGDGPGPMVSGSRPMKIKRSKEKGLSNQTLKFGKWIRVEYKEGLGSGSVENSVRLGKRASPEVVLSYQSQKVKGLVASVYGNAIACDDGSLGLGMVDPCFTEVN
ncbi:hypothetical protein Q3G72_028379 [Acer saccharum]|nr:hypothetical protein Q3G72_028379 [Acer saccharum]